MTSAPQLARARQHAVIGVEFLLQDQKAVDLGICQRRILCQLGIDVGDAVGDQPIHLVARGEVGMAGVGDALLVGPSADSRHIDVDQHADHVAPVAESNRFLDVRNELELVFEQLRRIEGAVVQGADILHAVDDPQMPVIAQVAGVAGAGTSLRRSSPAPWPPDHGGTP